MKYTPMICFGLGLLAATTGSAIGAESSDAEEVPDRTYTNPIIDRFGPADPHVFEHEGKYYMSFTDSARDYRIYTSPDLINWDAGPVIYDPGIEEPQVWAPFFYYHPEDDTFYLYYSVRHTVGVAKSSAPDQPFEKVHDLFEGSIDAHLFRDDDDELYLYFTTLGAPFVIYVQPMEDPVTPKDTPKIELLRPEPDRFPWERHNVAEAPWIHKRDGVYYLMYSAAGANTPYYCINYATSESPTGPFVRYEGNPIVQRDDDRGIFGPGHHSLVRDGAGELWMMYHQQNSTDLGWNRFVCIDPVIFDDRNNMQVTPTRGEPRPAPVPLPGDEGPDPDPVAVADPFVLEHAGRYYLYGTLDSGPNRGIPVRVSDDLIHWSIPEESNEGYALVADDVFGDRGFWAPSVVKHGGRFHMFYTANERISVARSDSPTGPFVQDEPQSFDAEMPAIDPHVFIDDDGQPYLFFVRLLQGNRIFVAELSSDLQTLRTDTMREIISAEPGWENSAEAGWPVSESPSVMKRNSIYYLFYTANDFRNPDYSVGYATASSPFGPWTKFEGNPILRRAGGLEGTGAAGVLRSKSGERLLVYHSHASRDNLRPRRTVYSRFEFVPRESGGPDAVRVIERVYFPRAVNKR